MKVDAREAVAGDASDLAHLHAAARDEVAAHKGGAMLLNDQARLDRSSTDDLDETSIVGLIDGVPVGYATVRLRALADHVLLADIDEIYVLEPARGVGVGAAILGEARRWARDHNAGYLESVVLPGARASKNFFEAAGMVTRLLRVSTPLSKEP